MATDRSLLRRAKRVRYTQLGVVPCDSPPGPEHNSTQFDVNESQPVTRKRKGRGPGKVLEAKPANARPEIWPVGNEEFTTEKKPRQITALITRLALQLMPGPCISFLMFDQHTRNILEIQFLERFKYRDGEDVNHCKEVLEAIAAKRYGEELREARKKCRAKFGWNTGAWKGMVPHWCKTSEYWEGLCDIYGTVEYQALSKRNQTNRCASGLIVSHYAGSISAYQHSQNLKKILGRESTAEELFLHLHVGRADGISPIVAQAAAAARVLEMQAVHDENNEGNEFKLSEEIIVEVPTYETSIMQFANTKTKEVYEKAKRMQLDPDYAGREDIELFRLAAIKKSHGRDWGFGSKFEDSMPTTSTSRARATSTSSVLTTEMVEQRNLEFNKILEERDARFSEKTDKRDKIIEGFQARFTEMANNHATEQAELHFVINHLYAMNGVQKPTYQGHGSISQPFHSAISQPFQTALGMRLPLSHSHGSVSPTTQGAVGINMPLFQDNVALNYSALLGMQVFDSQMQLPNSQGVGIQAFAAQASNGEAAMSQWCTGSNRDNPL